MAEQEPKYKTVYQTAADGTYIGPVTLSDATGDTCPITGEWLIPGGCVDAEPPEPGENQKAVWNGTTWILEDIPQPEPEPEPEPEPTLAEKKAALRAAINAERDRREQGGFEYNGVKFDSDTTSVIRINAAVNTAVAAVLEETAFSVDWTAADNTTATLDAQGLLGLSAALAAHSNTQHVRARELKDQLEQAEDETAVAEVENLLLAWQQE